MLTPKQQRLHSIVAHTLKHFIGKQTNKAARDLLDDGEAYSVDVTIEAKVNGKQLDKQTVSGTLNVGHDETTTGNINPDPAHVLALALERMPKTKREALLQDLPREFTAGDQALPDCDEQLYKQAEGLFEQLRGRTERIRRGGVAFIPSAD